MSDQTLAHPPAPLARLEQKLQRLGYVVVPHGADLCVRLPLLCSVRLHEVEGRMRLVPKFGPLSRSAGLFTTSGVAIGAVAGSALTVGLAPITAIVAFGGIAALVMDACRFIVTEGCLTRLQSLLDRGDEG